MIELCTIDYVHETNT